MNQKTAYISLVFFLLFSVGAMQAFVSTFFDVTLITLAGYVFIVWILLVIVNYYFSKKGR